MPAGVARGFRSLVEIGDTADVTRLEIETGVVGQLRIIAVDTEVVVFDKIDRD
jgi:hypothetical protein